MGMTKGNRRFPFMATLLSLDDPQRKRQTVINLPSVFCASSDPRRNVQPYLYRLTLFPTARREDSQSADSHGRLLIALR